MSLDLWYFLELTAIFIILSWSIYIVFRNGQLYYVPIAMMGVGAYFVAFRGYSFQFVEEKRNSMSSERR